MEEARKGSLKSEDYEFIEPQSTVELHLTPKLNKTAPSSYASPFSQFCMKSLSPIPGGQKTTSPGNTYLNNATPRVLWSTANSPSPLQEDKLVDFTLRTTSQRFIQKLDFSQLPSNSVQFKASSVNVRVNLAPSESAENLAENDTPPRNRPKKRIRENEVAEDSDTKPVVCNCQRSRCLKLYCDCFAAGQYCTNCNCIGCMNVPEYEITRKEAISNTLERNPQAFKPKINSTESKPEHNKGCHCKKSACLKKYCECFQSGVKCTDKCKCSGCKNKEDRKKKK